MKQPVTATHTLLVQWGLWEKKKDGTETQLGYPKKSSFYRRSKGYTEEYIKREEVKISDDEALLVNMTIARLPLESKNALHAYYKDAPQNLYRSAMLMNTSRSRAERLIGVAVKSFKLDFTQNYSNILEIS